jgi:hypothetical protein
MYLALKRTFATGVARPSLHVYGSGGGTRLERPAPGGGASVQHVAC